MNEEGGHMFLAFFPNVLFIDVDEFSKDASNADAVPFCNMSRLCRQTASGVHLHKFFPDVAELVWAPFLTLPLGFATRCCVAIPAPTSVVVALPSPPPLVVV